MQNQPPPYILNLDWTSVISSLSPSKNAASCTLERNSFPELVSPLLLSVGSDWSLPDNL